MRYIIQNILKENHRPTIGKTVYLIMDKSGKYVFTKFLTRGTYWVTMENYGNGDGYQSYTDIIFKNRKEAQEFLDLVIYCFQHQDRICSYKLEKDDQRNSFNPNDWEVVEYIQGLMPKDDTEIFDNLTESEDSFDWVEKPKITDKSSLEDYLRLLLKEYGFQLQIDWHQGNRYFLITGPPNKLYYVFPTRYFNKEYLKNRIDQHNREFPTPDSLVWASGNFKEFFYNKYKELERILLSVVNEEFN